MTAISVGCLTMTADSCLRPTLKSDMHEAHTPCGIASPVSLHFGSSSLAIDMRFLLGITPHAFEHHFVHVGRKSATPLRHATKWGSKNGHLHA
jgi:hypothetical protein